MGTVAGPDFSGFIPAVLFLFDPQLSIFWFRAVKLERRGGYSTEPLIWRRLKATERVLITIGILVVSAIGVAALFYTIPNLLCVWGMF
jgi:hypothetical protein